MSLSLPLGSILADIILAELENGSLVQQSDNFSLHCWYIDDALILCNDHINLIETLVRFNEVHPSIKFTCEVENSGRIAFLGVLLTRRIDKSLRRNINKKTTWYTNFLSFVTLQYKRNLIKTLHYGIETICSLDVVKVETLLYNTITNQRIIYSSRSKQNKNNLLPYVYMSLWWGYIY